MHTEDLSAWRGEAGAPALLALCNALRQRLEPSKPRSDGTPEDRTPPEQLHEKPVKPERPSHILGKLVGGVLALGILGGIAIQYLPNSHIFSTTSEDSSIPIEPKKVSQKQIKPPEMMRIPAGEFWMGSEDNDKNANKDEKPRHIVKVAAFAMGKYEVTKAEFAVFANDSGHQSSGCFEWNGSEWKKESGKNWQNPGFTQSDTDPVTCVSYNDVIAYIRWLNNKSGLNYRLPTEAEWEYAGRAGATGDFYWGQDAPGDYAWYADNSGNKTHPVGEKKSNEFGLYDTAGNAWEWDQDCYEDNYKQAPKNGSAWQPQDCATRVLRGGSWYGELDYLRSATRTRLYPGNRYGYIGFRLAQD